MLISFIVEDFFERIFWLTCFIFPLVVLINFDRLFLMRLLVIPDHVAKKFASMALMKMNKLGNLLPCKKISNLFVCFAVADFTA